jgi:hypothetical protein
MRMKAVKHHRRHGFADWKFNRMLLGNANECARRWHTLDDGCHACEHMIHLLAARESLAEASIAALGSETGCGKIANPSDAEKCLNAPAERDSNPGNLGKPTRDQRTLRVDPELHAVSHPGGDGDDVFACACELDSNEV